MKEESNYWLIPGQWANELHNAVGVQGKLFLTPLLAPLDVMVHVCVCDREKMYNLSPERSGMQKQLREV